MTSSKTASPLLAAAIAVRDMLEYRCDNNPGFEEANAEWNRRIDALREAIKAEQEESAR